MKGLLTIAALSTLLLATACQREATEYISINGKVFIFNIRQARAFYMLTLNRLPAAPDDAVVVAEFEDPAGGPPLIKKQKVFQSPDVDCVVTGKPYKIHITLKSAEGKTLQTIDTTLNSTLDSTMLPAHALVEGPAYDKTKDAYNRAGTIRFRKKCS